MNIGRSGLQNPASTPLEVKAQALRTIAICDANPVLADGILQTLQRDVLLTSFNTVVLETQDLATVKALAPNILIIDPWQTSGSREDALDRFSGLSDGISLICYTSRISPCEVNTLLSYGFLGILPKTVLGEELARVVCVAALGGSYLHESLAPSIANAGARPSAEGGVLPELTEREIEVLRQVALGSSMKEIAALLKISPKTVDTYKTRANLKLNLRSRADIVQYAIQSGWMT